MTNGFSIKKESILKFKSRMITGACLTILTVILSGCGGGGTANTNQTPAARTISGTVSYSGNVTPTHQIVIAATRGGEQAPASSIVIKKPGAFTLSNVSDASYTITAFMDTGDDMGTPQSTEPTGFY